MGEGTHVAFAAETRDQVDAFYEAALAAGGRDNGAPGLQAALPSRIITAPSCSIRTGMNIEAVCHKSVEDDREAHLHHRL